LAQTIWLEMPISLRKLARNLGQPCAIFVRRPRRGAGLVPPSSATRVFSAAMQVLHRALAVWQRTITARMPHALLYMADSLQINLNIIVHAAGAWCRGEGVSRTTGAACATERLGGRRLCFNVRGVGCRCQFAQPLHVGCTVAALNGAWGAALCARLETIFVTPVAV
jgi:hypothetical protein